MLRTCDCHSTDELAHVHMRPSSNWRAEFADYLTCLPCYYVQVSSRHFSYNLIDQNLLQPLRNALRLMGAPPNLIPDGYDGQLSYSIQTYLRKLKKQVSRAYCSVIVQLPTVLLLQAKIDSDRYILSVVKHKTVSDKPKTM